MSSKISCAILVVTLLYFTHNVTAQESIGSPTTTKNINDTILEFFNNCTCIPYYLCSEANKYMFAARANILPQNFFCSSKDLFCCKNATDVEPEPPVITTTTTTTEDAEDTSTTTETTLRHVDRVGKLSCGIAKTDVSVRILTTDTESATTIPGEIPWMVEIFQKRQDSKNPYRFKCAGSLIHPQVVLTATHCIVSNKERQLKIVATGREVFQNVGVDVQDERNVKKIIKHPEYYSGGLYNDIALLILENEYSFSNNFLNTICLPASNQSFSGKKCLAVGWGTNVNLESIPLRKVDVPIVDPEECQNLLRKTRLGNDFELHNSFTCAGGEEGKDTCKGDGGSPLICLGDQYEFVQAGIVSWGVDSEKCGLAGQPGLYADVTKFREWIVNQLTKNKITLT